MTSPYLESTPILSLAERRAEIEDQLAEIEREFLDDGVGLVRFMELTDRRSRLNVALANLSED